MRIQYKINSRLILPLFLLCSGFSFLISAEEYYNQDYNQQYQDYNQQYQDYNQQYQDYNQEYTGPVTEEFTSPANQDYGMTTADPINLGFAGTDVTYSGCDYCGIEGSSGDCGDCSDCGCGFYSWPICKLCGHQFSFGPEVFYIERKRKGGTQQTGVVYGGKIIYEFIKRSRMYWGADATYGGGRLSGHTATHNRVKSIFCDANIEGRVGYTLQQKGGYRFMFIPFVGGGASVENNHFVHPSPIHVHFRLYYAYVCTGFLTQMSCTPCFDAGFNFKAKFVVDAKNRISHDPSFDSSTCLVGNEVLYRIELPLTWHARPNGYISALPFYEFRHFGQHAGFPFDYVDTKENIYGLLIKFIYLL